MRGWVARNHEAHLAYRREYTRRNHARIRELQLAALTEEKIERWGANRRAARSEADRQREKRYMAEYRAKNPQHKIRQSLRAQVTNALRAKRENRSLPEIGCTAAELRRHIEAQWKPEMTWANYTHAGWHVDHRIPLAKFDLTDPAQRAQAAHFTNLQPLWAHEHQRKALKTA
jgi:hypothetical protein